MGRHGISKMKSNGLLLLSLYAEKGLTITNTLFELPVIHKSTWMHPRSKQWHQIDFIITRRRDIKDILITRAMRGGGADCWSDHILLRCRASFQLARRHRRQPSNIIKTKLDVSKLRNSDTRESFTDAITNSLQVMNTDGDDLETQWSTFKDTVFDTAKSVLGYSKRKQPDWFDESNHEIKDLLAKKRAAPNACLNDKSFQKKHDQYSWLRSQAQSKIRKIKDAWWADKVVELQGYADQHATKLFFSGLKAVYGSTSKSMTPIRAEDGTLLTDKAHILEHISISC